jgi:hypothetical protein
MDKVQTVANLAVLDEINLGQWFDCGLTVNGVQVVYNATTSKSNGGVALHCIIYYP